MGAVVSLVVGALAGLAVFNAIRGMSMDAVLERVKVDSELEESLRKLDLPFTAKQVQKCQYGIYLLGLVLAGIFVFIGDIWTALYTLCMAYLIGFLFKVFIIRKGKENDQKAVQDLPMYLDAVSGLVNAGYSLERGLELSLHVSPYVARQIKPVLLQWNNRNGPLAAIAVLEKSPIPEYQMLAAVLAQVQQGGASSLEILEKFKEQLSEINYFKRLAEVNKKPVKNTALLMIPFAGAVAAAFYPYFINAMTMFSGFINN